MVYEQNFGVLNGTPRILVFTGLFLLALASFVVPTASAAVGDEDKQPITAVVLVDESGSLDPAAVASERDAAAALVSSDLSKRSKFLVAGFGSTNRPSQTAVKPYCDFITTTSRIARDRLVSCANQVRIRKPAEGNDTDHAKAIQFALERLSGETVGTPVIFLLTDGVLDVRRSPSYGRVPGRRNAEAMRRLTQQLLPTARARDTQIWPLGFGSAVSKPSLDRFAAGGAGASTLCPASRASRPHATVVKTTGQVIHSLVAALGAARCGAVGPSRPGSLDGDETTSLTVAIPPIATDGAITVVKSNPRFRVDFYTPRDEAVPSNGTLSDGSAFERSGQSGRVESLHITDPVPGKWTVKVSDPLGRASHAGVSAFAVWEGALQASLFVSPVQPIPGRSEQVEVRVLSRDDVITGSVLKSVHVDARASAAFGSIPVPLKLDTRDGVFRGSFNIPADAPDGPIRIAARVRGNGVASDRRVDTVTIDRSKIIEATFDLDAPREIHPGAVIHGQVTTDNPATPRTGTLVLGDHSRGALLTLQADIGQIPTGTQRFPFTVKVDQDTPLAKLYATLYLVVDGTTKVSGASLDTNVTPVPPFPWWKVILAGALALLLLGGAGAFAWRGRRRRSDEASDIRGLVATLSRDSRVLSSIEADGGASPRPRFEMYLDLDEDHPHLRSIDMGGMGERIVVTRKGSIARVEVGEQEPVEIDLNMVEPVPVRAGLSLRIARRAIASDDVAPTEVSGGYDPGAPWPPDDRDMTNQPTHGAW